MIECHKNGIVGEGDISSRIFFVGTSPVKGEKIAFSGRPGQVLNNILKSIGLTRDNVYLTNLMCHYSESPAALTRAACAIRLEKEIRTYKPKIIVAFGEEATYHFTKLQLKKCRGAVLWNDSYKCYIMCTYQPASVFYGVGDTIHDIVKDLQKIPQIMVWPEDDSLTNIDYEVVTCKERAQEILNNLPEDTVAVDIETTNPDMDEMDVFVDRLICLSVATRQRSFVFPEAICKGLKWPKHPKYTFHNGMFDSGGLLRYLNTYIEISDDTMLMSYALDERQGHHKLKPLARGYCGCGFYEEETKAKIGKNPQSKEELDKLYEYNAKDGLYTARLADILLLKLHDDGVYPVYRELLVPAANAFSEIQFRGAHIDNNKIRELSMKWFPEWMKLDEELVSDAEALGYPGKINLNSYKQLGKLLFEILELPGGPSTKKEVLETIEDFHPYVKKLMKFRRLDHIVGNYILGIQDDIKTDSRVHAQVLLHGTVTGRLSYHKPPLQTIPKPRSDEDQDFLELREMFNTTSDEYCIVETDFEKAEVWGAYSVSGDPNLLEDLQSVDFHRRVASEIYETPFELVTERQRFNSKRTTFGIIYGIQDNTLAKTIGTTKQEAHEIRYRWYRRYNKYFEWYERTKEELFREGEVVGPTGRKRRFKIFVGNFHDKVNQAINSPIQALASDVTLASTIKLHHLLKEFDSYILWCVHDAIIFEVRKKYLNEVLHLIKNTMSAVHFKGVCGIPVEIKVGDRLSSTEKVKI